jgi:hypothetical protein
MLGKLLIAIGCFLLGWGLREITMPATIAHNASTAIVKRVDSDNFQKSLDEACEENPKLKRCLLRR